MTRAEWIAYYSRPRARHVAGALGTTSDSVHALKLRLDPQVAALHSEATACALPLEKRAAWDAFRAAWLAYRDGPDAGILGFGTGPIFDEGLAFEGQIGAWEKDLAAAGCAPVAPPVQPHGGEEKKGGDDALKWLGIGAAVLGGAILVKSFT